MTGKKRDLQGDMIDNIDIIDFIDVKRLFVPFLCLVGKSGKYRLGTKGTSKANIITAKHLSLSQENIQREDKRLKKIYKNTKT